MKGTKMMTEQKRNERIPLRKALLERFQNIAEELGFTSKEMEQKFKKHYADVDKTQGDRCVDDRKTQIFENYSYDKGKYNGRQFAGGTFGIIGALRIAAEMNENEARTFVKDVYHQQGWQIGDHIDDEHGHITDPKKLLQRNKGCGNQDKIRDGEIPMYSSIVSPEDVDDRFNWIKDIDGYLPVLTGEHEPQGAGINLVENTTFNTNKAVKNQESIFNLDLAEAHHIGQVFYNEMDEEFKQKTEKGDFVNSFVDATIRDYLETLSALCDIREIQYRM